MSKEQALAAIKAAGWTAASQVGWREAIKMLQEVAREMESAQWQDSR